MSYYILALVLGSLVLRVRQQTAYKVAVKFFNKVQRKDATNTCLTLNTILYKTRNSLACFTKSSH